MITVEYGNETITLRNTLGDAASAYLRTAAHQPIAWQQWGEGAFELARTLDRPILLDIGAVWCHWCHVMDHESYENPDVARLINESFIAIKVDRDERPDVDGRYQRLVQAISQQGGGWPLTAFLTPSGHVFGGGTYFPRTDRMGRIGMLSLLPRMAAFYAQRGESAADEIRDVNRQILDVMGERLSAGDLNPHWLTEMQRAMAQDYEAVNGGFGTTSGPKFPSVGAVEFFLRLHQETGDDAAREMALDTLNAMAAGGIHDQLAGGFHRYSVDGEWHVPHFEKMLYDNAGLLTNFAHAYALTGDERHRETAVGIIDFVTQVLWNDEIGAFGGSQDADVGPDDDGDFFTWTPDEVRAVLDEQDYLLASRRWDIGVNGDMHHNPAKNVLRVAIGIDQLAETFEQTPAEIRTRLDSIRTRMLAARLQRPAPFVDPTVYVSWNGMMIQGLVAAAHHVGDPRAEEFAVRTTDNLTTRCWSSESGWCHTVASDGTRSGGYLDDQAQMALALLDLHQLTGERRYRELAMATLDVMLRRFTSERTDALRDTPIDEVVPVESLSVPSHNYVDQPTAAPNPVAALALVTASAITGDPAWQMRGERIMRAFAGETSQAYGHMAGTAALAVGALVWSTPSVVIVGDPGDERTQALHRAALSSPRLGLVVRLYSADEENLPYPASSDGSTVAYVCAGQACAEPTGDVERVVELARMFGLGSSH